MKETADLKHEILKSTMQQILAVNINISKNTTVSILVKIFTNTFIT